MLAYLSGLLTGNPKGIDTYAYLTKIRLTIDYFPHINWNPYWDSGTPFWIWSYPPAAMTFTAALVKILNITAEQGLTMMAITSFIIFLLGIYYFINHLTKSSLTALLTILVLVSSPSTWSWWNGGNYVRVFGLGILGLALLFNLRHLELVVLGKWQKGFYILSILSLGLALSSHLLIGGIVVSLLFLFFLFSDLSWQRKSKEFLKVFLPGLFLSSYWYIPLFLTGKPASRFFGRDPAFAIDFKNFIAPVVNEENFSLSGSVLPFFGFGIFIFLILLIFRKLKVESFQKRIAVSLFLASLAAFIYNSIGHISFYPETWYIIGFPPITAFSIFGIFLVIFSGLIIGLSLQSTNKYFRLLVLLLALILVSRRTYLDLNYLRGAVDDVLTPGSLQSINQQAISVNYPTNFRFGTDSAFVADWFNYKYDVYQTRDYFGQGITYPDWQNWFETATWYWQGNYDETNFLLDWYGVKEFFVGNPHYRYKKFLKREDIYTVENHKTPIWQEGTPPLELYQFNYLNASPILTARNSGVFLVIGRKEGYDFFLRSLAQTGIDSQSLIPVRGRERIDSYSNSELAQFDGLVIYEYSYKDKEKTTQLLKDFLSQKKVIFWETQGSSGKNLETSWEILPVEKSIKGKIWKDWKIEIGQNPKAGSQILRTEEDKPVVVAWDNNNGKIIWSGLNLPFLVNKKNQKDIYLFKKILDNLNVSQETSGVNYEAVFPNPEKREIKVLDRAKGILLKESYFPNWNAYSNGTKLKIYPAGPDLMYVFLPDGNSSKVIFEYKISVVEKISWLITIVSFILIMIYLLEDIIFPKGLGKKIISPAVNLANQLNRRIGNWWDRNED